MKVRRSQKHDIPGIKRVLESSALSEFALAPLDTGQQDDLTDIDLDIAALEIEMEILDNTRAISVLADDNGEVLAYARCWLNSLADGTGKISHVGVLQEHQGKGIGTELMKYLITLSREHQHIKRLELEVARDNAAAVKVYERLGFRSKPPEMSRLTITGPRMHIRMFRDIEAPEFPAGPPRSQD